MRCYFLLVSHGDAILDETGVKVTSLKAAEAKALRAIQQMCEEDSEAGDRWQLSVTDGSGHVLLPIPLDAETQQRKSDAA